MANVSGARLTGPHYYCCTYRPVTEQGPGGAPERHERYVSLRGSQFRSLPRPSGRA